MRGFCCNLARFIFRFLCIFFSVRFIFFDLCPLRTGISAEFEISPAGCESFAEEGLPYPHGSDWVPDPGVTGNQYFVTSDCV